MDATAHSSAEGRSRLLLLLPAAGILAAAWLSMFWDIHTLTLPSFLHAAFAGAPAGRATPEYSILLYIRLPRILLALFAGGCLAVAGALFQVLLRNVLADPYILGIASGATVGAYTMILTGLSGVFFLALPLGAFIGSVLVAALVFSLARSRFVADHNALLLSGVMVGTFLAAFTLLILTTERSTYQNAVKWLLGSLTNATLESAAVIAPVALLSGVFLYYKAHALNVLSLGAGPAQLLGLSPKGFSFQVYLIACLLTAVIVCFTGSIGFVGLVIPHICRILFGSDHKVLLPASFLTGALFLIVADFIARITFYPIELPVGAVTALLGAPLFIYLLKKT